MATGAKTDLSDHGQRLGGALLVLLGLAAGITGAVLFARAVRDVDPHSWQLPNVLPSVVAILLGLVALLAGGWLYAKGLSRTHSVPAVFLSPQEEEKVVLEIESFEKRTSGELRVHLASAAHAGGSILEEAKRTFEQLGLTATRERNGVLFYVAVREHQFAVLGDQGINDKVPPGFWDQVAGRVSQRFAEGQFGQGLVEGIDLAGEALATHFPPRHDDQNELPNQISRG